MFKKILTSIMCMLTAISLLVSCSSAPSQNPGSSPTPSSNDKVVKLAYIGPMTGDYSQYGTFAKRGFETVLNAANYKAGEYTIQLDYYDDANDTAQTVALMQKVIDDPDLLAILGPFASTNALAIAPAIQKAGIIHYAITSSHPDITATGEYVFRGCHISSREATALADYLAESNIKTVSMAYLKNDFGITLYDAFQQRCAQLNIQLVEAIDFAEGSGPDFSPIVTRLTQKNPDVVYIAAMYNDSASFLKSLNNLDYQGKVFISPGAVTDELISLVGEQMEGIYSVMPFYLNDPNPSFVTFRENYNKAYDGAEPNMFVVFHYDAMATLLAAIEAVGNERKAVRDYMNSGVELPCAGGTYVFNETRDPQKSFYPLRYTNGSFTLA